MKKVVAIMLLLLSITQAHAQNTFEHVFLAQANVVDVESCVKSIELSNGDYIAMGFNPGCEFCFKTYYIRKYDHQGNLIFERLISIGSGGDYPDLIQTKDGNLLFYYGYGFATANLTLDFRLYFSKIDLNGNTIFTKDYYLERPDQNGIFSIQLNELGDSSVIYSCNVMMMKLSPSLDSIKAISPSPQIYSVDKLFSGSDIFTQYLVQNSGLDTLVYVVYSNNMDSMYFLFGDNSNFVSNFGVDWHLYKCEQLDNNTYLAIARKNMQQIDSIAYVKLDGNLNPYWIRYGVYPRLSLEFLGTEFSSTTVTYWGTKFDPVNDNDSAFYYRLNINTGDSLQFKTFLAEPGYYMTGLYDLKYCSEGYLISGYARADTTGQKSYFAVLDTNGNVSSFVPTIGTPTMHVYNNPTANDFAVELSGEKIYTYTLIDELGRILEVKKGNGLLKFNLQQFKAGSYFLNVT